jgi:glycerol-3-phosphate acyltransferase PlsY
MLLYIFVFTLAYLLGSIPTAVWIGKIFYNKDVREFGSKNAGATNTFRVLGTKAGIPVMLIDVAKGFAACSLVYFIPELIPQTDSFISVQMGLGLTAVMGHIYPVFAGFRGGKGIATLLGMALAIQIWPGLICLGIFLIVLIISQYVSLSSITASICYPILIILVFHSSILSLKIFSLLVSLLVIYTHRLNIKRLLAHEENRVYFLRKRPGV